MADELRDAAEALLSEAMKLKSELDLCADGSLSSRFLRGTCARAATMIRRLSLALASNPAPSGGGWEDAYEAWVESGVVNDWRTISFKKSFRAGYLAALSPVQPAGWRDIESAPKDGTQIDLWIVFPEPEAGAHRYTDALWDTKHAEWRFGQFRASQYTYTPTVTHWQPLPEPPAAPAASTSTTEGAG